MTKLLCLFVTFVYCLHASNAASFLDFKEYAVVTNEFLKKLEAHVKKFENLVDSAVTKSEDEKKYYDNLIKTSTPDGTQDIATKTSALDKEIEGVVDIDGGCADEKFEAEKQLKEAKKKLPETLQPCTKELDTIQTNLNKQLQSISNGYADLKKVNNLVKSCSTDKTERKEILACLNENLKKFNTKWEDIKKEVASLERSKEATKNKVTEEGTNAKNCITKNLDESLSVVRSTIDDYKECVKDINEEELVQPPEAFLH